MSNFKFVHFVVFVRDRQCISDSEYSTALSDTTGHTNSGVEINLHVLRTA